MVDEARARPPAALEVEAPPVVRNAAHAPALGRDDGGEEMHGVAPMRRRHEPVDPVEVERLPPRGDLRLAPDGPVEPEVLHPGRSRERVQPRLADQLHHAGRRGVVRPADHRSE